MAGERTMLDAAYEKMVNDPDDNGAELSFFSTLADSELHLLLDRETGADTVEPRLFEIDDARVALVFDQPERLVEFTGGVAPSAMLSGRLLVEMLAGHGISLGLNLDVAPSSMVLPAEAIEWLARMTAGEVSEIAASPTEVRAPRDLPKSLLRAMDATLARAEGLARHAYLVAVEYKDGRRGHMLAVIDPAEGAEGVLARAIGQAVVFSGIDAAELDAGFFRSNDPICARLERVGLRFDIPEAPKPQKPHHAPPGSDPEKPPRLR